jgi:hypothetical protein
MAPLFPVNVDYSQRDQRTLFLRLQGLIRSVFPQWTDFSEAGFDNMLLESMSFIGDNNAYYQNKQSRGLYWPTVTQRINAIRLGQHINFTLRSAVQATTTERFSLPSVAAVAVPIPVGTRVRTPDPNSIIYRVTEADTLPIGASFVDVPIEQAELIQGEAFPSSGAPNQRLQLTQSPYIDNTAEVRAADGDYRQVSSFLDADPDNPNLPIGPDSKVYKVTADPFDRGIILFGNGKSGKIPEGNIVVNYKIGGGTAGNVDAGEIKVIDEILTDDNGQVAPISVSNTVEASGGLNRETVLQARARGPQSLRVLERTVTKEDFEIVALSVPGVIRAVMVTSNEDAAVQENTGTVLAIASGAKLASGRIAPAAPSSALLQQILTKITVDKPHTLTFEPSVEASPFRTINVSTRVFLDSGTVAATVGAAVKESVKDFFAALLADGTVNPAIDFGANLKQADGTVISEIAWSDVFNAVNDTTGVRKVSEGAQGLLLNSLRSSVTLGPRDFPKVGTVQVVDADTGAAL